MNHLLGHRDHRVHSYTFQELTNLQLPDVIAHEKSKRSNPSIDQRKLFGKMPKLSSLEDYARAVKDATPHKCLWGSILEIYLISHMHLLNVALYIDKTSDNNMFTLCDSIFVSNEAHTIYLRHTNGGTHFNRICGVHQNNSQQTRPVTIFAHRSQFLY